MQILACDHCGAPNAARCHIAVDRGLDPAGAVSTSFEVVDLCPKCQEQALRQMVADLPFEVGWAWVNQWKTSPPQRAGE